MAKEPTFSFPYEPYEIQKVFMKELYSTIENSKFGIFESPTGTGKSLSICCATLQWLEDNYEQKVQDLETKIKEMKINSTSTEASNDWLQEEYEKIKRNQELAELQKQYDRLKEREQKFVEMRQRVERQKLGSVLKKTSYRDKMAHPTNNTHTEENNEELPTPDDQDLILEDTEQADDDDEEQDCDDEETEEKHRDTQVVIASRTHSQLSQLVGEIRKTRFREGVRVVTLASRQHYCINQEVTRLNNSHLINERCLELQKSSSKATAKTEDGKVTKKSKTKSCGSCPYYKQSNITAVKERVLVELMDMEDIVSCGKQLNGCPYYATKKAAEDAQVLLLSHCALMSPAVTAGLGVSVEDAVVVVDEGHGLLPALHHAHTHTAAHAHTHTAHTALHRYLHTYRGRLSSRNLLTLNQLLYVLRRLTDMLKPPIQDNNEETKIYSIRDFLSEAEIDHINLRPLVDFCKKSRLVPKLHGFSMRYKAEDSDLENKSKSNQRNNLENFLNQISKKKDKEQVIEEKAAEENNTSQEVVVSVCGALYGVLGVVEALTHSHLDGRVLLQRGPRPSLQYLLLDPGGHFAEIVAQCRSVVVCGGTMSPMSEFRALLGTTRETVEVAVGHVVPPHHLLALGVDTGPAHTPLTLTHTTRGDGRMLSEVCGILRNVCAVVRGGVVCFTPSYTFESSLYAHLQSHGLDHIRRRKAVFREPRDSKDVDQVLSKYAEAVNTKSDGMTGALLLSVVGGKLSEGLNFSDNLGRCVLVVGVPYPNVKSPELQERIQHRERTAPGEGAQLAHNICFKAVNQSIGRAVRHISDYAVVLLVDTRYSHANNIQALPAFVQKSFVPNVDFGSAMRHMAKFFATHKKTTDNKV